MSAPGGRIQVADCGRGRRSCPLAPRSNISWPGQGGSDRISSSEGKVGRDRNRHAFTALVSGGGFRAGLTHGVTDDFGYKSVQDPVSVHDLHATILHTEVQASQSLHTSSNPPHPSPSNCVRVKPFSFRRDEKFLIQADKGHPLRVVPGQDERGCKLQAVGRTQVVKIENPERPCDDSIEIPNFVPGLAEQVQPFQRLSKLVRAELTTPALPLQSRANFHWSKGPNDDVRITFQESLRSGARLLFRHKGHDRG